MSVTGLTHGWFSRQTCPDPSPAAPHPPAPLGARVRAPVGWRISDAPGVPPSPRSRGKGWVRAFSVRLLWVAAQLCPIVGRLFDDTSGLRAKHGNRILRPENVELAVSDYPSLRISFILCPARQGDRAKTLELRCIVVGIGNESGAMLGSLEPIGRVVIGRLVVGRTLFRMTVGKVGNRVVTAERQPPSSRGDSFGRQRNSPRGDECQDRQADKDRTARQVAHEILLKVRSHYRPAGRIA